MSKKKKYSLIGGAIGFVFPILCFLILINLPSDFSVEYGWLIQNFLEFTNPAYMIFSLGGRLDMGLGGAIFVLTTMPLFWAAYGAIAGFFIGRSHDKNSNASAVSGAGENLIS